MNLEEKLKKDCAYIVQAILHNEQARYMVRVLQKGPPKDLGYMWGLNEPDYWTQQEKGAISTMHIWVLQKGWESSGYGIMMRKIQRKIKELAINKSPMIYNDDEGKWDGDSRNGIGYINNISLRRIDYIG